MIDESRKLFEEWFLGENPTMTDRRAVERHGAGYILMKTRCDWIAWQAAWDAKPSVIIPSCIGIDELEYFPTN